MSLNKLLKLQLFYCFLGVLFNVISCFYLFQNGETLTPTSPILGIIVMSIYGVFLLAGQMKRITLYRTLMFLAVVAFGYSGIIKHFITLNDSPELYYSIMIGIVAILINSFGVVLNITAALGRFKIAKNE